MLFNTYCLKMNEGLNHILKISGNIIETSLSHTPIWPQPVIDSFRANKQPKIKLPVPSSAC
ncbi:hypothetical protein CANTEDRAFT_114540 [Yamadazyma tenuis ATCC 10573]|uniref:Uncharacterized protein n=1 Tax=Candida tenuis (strain ATCC 10573 / BCRC 21748 / CBS 615 / JCM 9827 / NBRC 10315 / NRRL Y-1498 / VKM Y-70) TaxID=590646 RepID=G3B5I5_CANTC|nr:uncharacterized protein CANTEDRAFT_114540 [Yamadazyma tenuis ATCC 10573]EGV63236.1 hypothetical protein CANTEDRAFT_114540 [Yamadazyma tenuis ATCC 10573]